MDKRGEPVTPSDEEFKISQSVYGKWAKSRYWTRSQLLCLLLGLPVLEEKYLKIILESSASLEYNSFWSWYPVSVAQVKKLKRLSVFVYEAISSGALVVEKEVDGQPFFRPRDAVEWGGTLPGLEIPSSFRFLVGVIPSYTAIEEGDILDDDINITKILAEYDAKTSEREGQASHDEAGYQLDERASKMHDEVQKTRSQVVILALDSKFPKEDEREAHVLLISKLGLVSKKDFKKYNGKSKPQTMVISHRARALAAFLCEFNNNLSIRDLYKDDLMKQIVFCGKKIEFSTFRTWMHLEEIYDRKLSLLR